MPPTQEQLTFVDTRWDQLNTLTKDATDKALTFLMLTNSGGAIATLSFLGAVKDIRSQWPPKIALALFIIGIILVGIFSSMWVHHIEHLYMSWRKDATRFIEGHVDWKTLTQDDETRSFAKITRFYVAGYLSFFCFVAGAAIGLCLTHF